MNDQDELIPDDDPAREAVQIGADDDGARHLAVVGDTYTVLVAGSDTAGRYTLIDMLVPQGGGPPARLLCMCTPAGQEEFFELIGDAVPTRTSPPPPLTDAEMKERMKRAMELAPRFKTELLIPDAGDNVGGSRPDAPN